MLAIGATAFLAIALVLLGRRRPDYSPVRDTISELGEVGAADQSLVAYGVFLPVGVLLIAVAYLMQPVQASVSLLALCTGLGYLVAVAFPCDKGSPLWGSARQSVHNLGGAIEYIGGALALIELEPVHGAAFRTMGIAVFASAIALSVQAFARVRGLVQRVAEACLFGGLVYAVYRSGP